MTIWGSSGLGLDRVFTKRGGVRVRVRFRVRVELGLRLGVKTTRVLILMLMLRLRHRRLSVRAEVRPRYRLQEVFLRLSSRALANFLCSSVMNS